MPARLNGTKFLAKLPLKPKRLSPEMAMTAFAAQGMELKANRSSN